MGKRKSGSLPATVSNAESAVEETAASRRETYIAQALYMLEERREQLHRGLSILVMTNEALKALRDDSDQLMHASEALQAAQELIKGAWLGLDSAELARRATAR